MSVSVTNILLIIQLALTALSSAPVIGGDAALAAVFVKILQAALAEYQTQTGKPFDATTIPQEAPLP